MFVFLMSEDWCRENISAWRLGVSCQSDEHQHGGHREIGED